MAEYNKIKGESEWNENKQRDFNKKLEDLLENDGEKKKPGQRSPSDNPTTWWNWEALDQKAPNQKASGWKKAVQNFFDGLAKLFSSWGHDSTANAAAFENYTDSHSWLGKSDRQVQKSSIILVIHLVYN